LRRKVVVPDCMEFKTTNACSHLNHRSRTRAAATGVQEGLWVLKLIREMRGALDLCEMTLCCDNEAAIALMKNPTAGVQGRSKHIDVQFHFVRERYQRKHIKVHFVPSEHQLADIFTKQLPTKAFEAMRKEIGVRPLPIKKD
jgi:hypothetical protein